jgi:hypothetical protein
MTRRTRLSLVAVTIAVLCALALLGVTVFWRVVHTPAFNEDNLFALSFGPAVGHRESLLTLLTAQYGVLPAYRPFPMFTLWLQYKLAGLAPESYFVVNIALLVGLCAALYALLYRMTGSWAAAGGSAFALLVDPRLISISTTIGERETAIVSLLGLLALLAVLAPPARARPRLIGVAVFLLLLLAALSKEYGLAFSAAVLVAALLNRSARSRPVVVAVVGAVVAYAALRWGVVGGTTGDYCEDMGYFDQLRRVCFGHNQGEGAVLLTGGAELAQHAYNMGAAFLGTFFPFLFTGKGSLTSSVSVPLVVWSLIVTGLAIVAWVRIPRAALPFLALIVANSLLSVASYRERNLVVAVTGLYGAAGLGAVQAAQWLRSRDVRLGRIGFAAAAAAAAALWVGYQSLGRAGDLEHLRQERENTLARITHKEHKKKAKTVDPCLYLTQRNRVDQPYIAPSVVHYVKHRYHLPDPSCRSALRVAAAGS